MTDHNNNSLPADRDNAQADGALENAEAIIERFGGIRPMASKMSVPVTTVQGWKKRNVIPENRRDDVIRAAGFNNIDISDLIAKGGANENAGAAPGDGFGRAMRAAQAETEISGRDGADDEVEDADEDMPQFASRPAFSSTPYESKPLESKPFESRPYESQPLTSPAPLRGASADAFDPEAFRDSLIAAGKRAVRKSVLASFLLLLICGGVAVGLLSAEIGENRAGMATLDHKTAALDKRVGLIEQGRALVGSVTPEDVQQKLAGLEDQITSLSQQVQGQMQGSSGGIIADAGQLLPRVAAIEAQMARMAQAGGLTALVQHLQQMQQSAEGQQQLAGAAHDLYAAIEGASGDAGDALGKAFTQSSSFGDALKGLNSDGIKAAALAVATADLNGAIGRSAPFDEDLQLVSVLMGDAIPADIKGAIEQLSAQSKQGVLTQAALVDQLKNMAPGIVEASLQGQDVSMRDKAIARLNDLVQVSKDGALVTGTDAQGTVTRAQTLLEKGDLQGAIAELQGLRGGALNTARPFIDAASATLLARRLQGSIDSTVSGMLGIGGAALTTQDAGFGALAKRAADALPPAAPEPLPLGGKNPADR